MTLTVYNAAAIEALSDTPRTDAVCWPGGQLPQISDAQYITNLREHARTLEREIARLTEALAGAQP